MIEYLLKWLTGGDGQPDDPDELQLAIVALLVQAARMDDRFDEAERATIERLLASRFGLGAERIRALLALAEYRAETSSQLFSFTQLVVERLAPPERVQVIEMLYEVVYAGGTIDPDEDALIRRIAGLIYVPDVERGAARKRARQTLGLPD